jgi:hypothetical protein
VTDRAKEIRAGDVLEVEVTMSDGNIKFFHNHELQGEGQGVQQGMVPCMGLGGMGCQVTLLSFTCELNLG